MHLGWRTFPKRGEYGLKHFNFCAEEENALERAASLLESAAGEGRPLEEHDAVVQACESLDLALACERAGLIAEALRLNSHGTGILGLLILDESIEEIAVTGLGKPVRVYVRGVGWRETNCAITSEEFALCAANAFARPMGRRLTYSQPRLNASSGRMRLHASMPPVSKEVEITIRKFTKEPMTMEELVQRGMLTCRQAKFLEEAVRSDRTVIIAGNTGSGKTTLLNALFQFVPKGERIVVIEETPELSIPQEHCVSLVANEELGIGMRSLVRDCLRMRPDRVAIGEVRTPGEAKALFDSLLAGQAKAAYATFHANSASEALERLESMGVRRTELDALGLIIVCKRTSGLEGKDGFQGPDERKVTEIASVRGGKSVRVKLA